MVSVTLRRYTPGNERTYYNKYGHKTGRSVGSGTFTSKDIWLCRPCHRKRERKRERKRTILVLTTLSVAVLILVISSPPKSPPGSTVAQISNPEFSHPLEASAYTPPHDPRLINHSLHSQPDPIQLREVNVPGVAALEPEPAPNGTHQDSAPTLCDRLAANPNDNDKHPHAPGVPYEILRANAPSAIDACKNATLEAPDVLRLRYQYARALQSISPEQAGEYLIPVVEAGYPAAFDNYGWLNIRLGGDIRVSERYFREGAERGNADAMHSLAELIIKKRIRPHYRGEAIDLMHEAAKRDHQSAIAFLNEYEEKRRSKQAAEDIMLNILGGVLGNR